MTTARPAVAAIDVVAEPENEPRQCHVHLGETPAGWVLTITIDAQTSAELATAVTAGHRLLRTGGMTVAITPNLVPGEPFEVSDIRVVVAGH